MSNHPVNEERGLQGTARNIASVLDVEAIKIEEHGVTAWSRTHAARKASLLVHAVAGGSNVGPRAHDGEAPSHWQNNQG